MFLWFVTLESFPGIFQSWSLQSHSKQCSSLLTKKCKSRHHHDYCGWCTTAILVTSYTSWISFTRNLLLTFQESASILLHQYRQRTVKQVHTCKTKVWHGHHRKIFWSGPVSAWRTRFIVGNVLYLLQETFHKLERSSTSLESGRLTLV